MQQIFLPCLENEITEILFPDLISQHINLVVQVLGHRTHGNRKREPLLNSYKEGLQWVMWYYYRGPPSWSWFYPYYHAPLANDLADYFLSEKGQTPCNFEPSAPLEPFEQLMSVLPSASKGILPKCFQPIFEEGSPVKDFYPEEFQVREKIFIFQIQMCR